MVELFSLISELMSVLVETKDTVFVSVFLSLLGRVILKMRIILKIRLCIFLSKFNFFVYK